MKFYFMMLFCLILFNFIFNVSIGLNEYEYMKQREYLKNYELQFRKAFTLSEQENVVNMYIKYLKSKEFIRTKDNFYPARPIEKELKRIQNTDIYKLLKRMPKGGNLHYHEYQGLDRNLLLDMIMQSPEYDMLHICDGDECQEKYKLTYFKHALNTTKGWTRVKGSVWTRDDIVRKTTLSGILNSLNTTIYPTDTGNKWRTAGDVFIYYEDVVTYNVTRYQYLQKVLDTSLNDEFVQIMEFRRGIFENPWYFADDGSRVEVPMVDEMNALRRFKQDYVSKNPHFIDFIFLMAGLRSFSKEVISEDIDKVIQLQVATPDMVRGYDLVQEEDGGHTYLFHSDSLMRAYNKSKTSNGTFNFYFHTGETNWPEDNEPSQFGDDVSTNENTYDSLVLETKRIGHGLGFAKHPALLEIIKERDIALELCPTSNQMLGYTPDLRNHPGIQFYRGGVSIVLAGDDPGTFGYNELTVDYYMVSMAWGLDLSELKQIAFNSITYSAIPDEIKKGGVDKFNDLWLNVFIKDQVDKICKMVFTSNVNVSGVRPLFGQYDRTSNISIFGYGYENGLCKKIICKFGDYSTIGQFYNYHEIHCPTPVVKTPEITVRFKLLFDNLTYDTGYDFKFVDMLEEPTSFSPISNHHSLFNYVQIIFFAVFMILEELK